MPSYRRRHILGGTYFFTVVTENREPLFLDPLARKLLHASFEACLRALPFDAVAIVLLPDHLHAIWTLPDGDDAYSERWTRIKGRFSHDWLAAGGHEQRVSDSRSRHRQRGVWQRKFWEHHIRDERDYERHMNYVHYNPIKHGLAACAHEYPYSSFGKWVKRSVYERQWCCGCGGRAIDEPDFDGLDVTAME